MLNFLKEFVKLRRWGKRMGKEQEPVVKKEPKRVGLELDDAQLSQVPNPQVVKKEKELEEQKKKVKKMRLGSFWTDKY